MTRRILPPARRALRAALPLALAAALAACAGAGGEGDGARVAGGGDFCTDAAAQVDQAQRFNFLTEFASAEAIWTRLSALYSDPERNPRQICGDMLPRHSEVMANQALVYSNQRKFVAAEGMFRAAEAQAAREAAAAEAEAEAGGAGFIEVLRTQHELNRATGGEGGALARANALAADIGEDFDGAAMTADIAQVLQLSPEAQRRRVLASLGEFSRSFVFLQQEKYAEAEDAIDRALALIAPVPGAQTNYAPRYATTKALLQIGQGEYEGARLTARGAADAFSEDLAGTALRARALAFQARAETFLERREEALETYAEAFSIYQDTAVPIGYDLVWPYFNLALTTMEAQPERREALTRAIFSAAQTLRSRATAASLAVAARDRAEGEGAEAEAYRAFQSAQIDLQRIQANLGAAAASPLVSNAQREDLRRQFQEALQLRDARKAALDALESDITGLLTARTDVDALIASLRPDEALVQIIPGAPYSMAFVVTSEGLRAGRVGGSVGVEDIREFVRFLRGRLRGGAPFRPNDSYALYEEMIAPALALLGAEQPKKLIFSLSDALTALPVETLAVKRSSIPDSRRRQDFTDVEWMADRYEISYVPAPSTLVALRRGQAPAAAGEGEGEAAAQPRGPQRLVAWGDFQPGATARDVLPGYLPDECLVEAQAVANLGALPGSAPELAMLRSIFDERVEINAGAAFTEEAVVTASAEGRLAAVDVLHFSTHGFLPLSDDCINQGGLTVSTARPGDDGVLDESEIRRLDLSGARLVVLTACDTAGAGQANTPLQGNAAEGGEALSGLARAFFDAGARAALVTHWPIADGGPSLKLVEEFYTRLDAGETYTEALSAAQRAVRADPATSDPFYWAA
ncbi:CHAT domain-containing protein, partial [Rhodovulum sp. DZ06]|uniref:CHAT domain-containing protein n=1 Tax=Rhodovulum sp. DZ06 TaxID=3425126 RepID=UPI003D328A4E